MGLWGVGCQPGAPGGAVRVRPPATGTAAPASQPESTAADARCQATLARADAILAAPAHPCHAWVKRVVPRTAAISHGGSAALWSTCTERGTALVVSALHNFAWRFHDADIARQKYWNVNREGGAFVLSRPESKSGSLGELAHALWPLFTPDVPASEWGPQRRAIQPRRDFVVAVVDGQRQPAEPDVGDGDSGIRVRRPFPFDALSSTGAARAGITVLVAGYPQSDLDEPALTVSSGPVLSDDEARAALGALKAAGDEEGRLAYEPEVEFLVAAGARHGMSGSGVFSEDGALLGVAVRASSAPKGPRVVRVVRMSHVQKQLRLSDPAGRQRAKAFLEAACDERVTPEVGLVKEARFAN